MEPADLRQKLTSEGFPIVYEWKDEAGKIYQPHQHQDKVALYVTRGQVTFDFGGEKKTIRARERLDVPPRTMHSTIVGDEGCEYVVGQMIEEDA